jgi:hypothetical protein
MWKGVVKCISICDKKWAELSISAVSLDGKCPDPGLESFFSPPPDPSYRVWTGCGPETVM